MQAALTWPAYPVECSLGGEMKAPVMAEELEPATTAANPATPCLERRRPGRLNDIHPSLIPLLRDEAASEFELELEDIREDGLAPAIGVAMSAVLSSLIWMALGFPIWVLFW
jgi:hypothetical protein